MRLTLAEIRWMQKGLSSITQLSLPIKISYRLSKLMRFCNKELAAIENARVDLVKKLSVENPDVPGEFRVPPINEKVFREEFESLLKEEVECDFVPIKLSELGEDLKISPLELSSLYRVIDGE